MHPTTPSPSLGFVSSLGLALRSYGADLRAWAGGLASGYVTAIAFMALGAICILIAAGVGVAACFHVIEIRYGPFVAYAAVGGFFFVLGLIGVLTGRWLLKRPAPHLPYPRRQAQMLKLAGAVPAAGRLVGGLRRGSRRDVDPVTQALAAAAAITFVGWICMSRFGHHSDGPEDE